MRIFVTGASGWIGSAVVPEMLGVPVTRWSAWVEVLHGDLADFDSLRAGATDADGVIHLTFNHDDFNQMELATQADALAIEAMGAALEGSDKPLIIASGTPVVPGHIVTERDHPPAFGPMAGRAENARSVIDMAGRGVRSIVVRIPPSVYGDGDEHGLIVRVIEIARNRGASGYVVDGTSFWPAVHFQVIIARR